VTFTNQIIDQSRKKNILRQMRKFGESIYWGGWVRKKYLGVRKRFKVGNGGRPVQKLGEACGKVHLQIKF